MADLKSLQQDMAALILKDIASERLLGSIEKTPLSAKDRLQVHKNNYRLTLSAALIDIYPVLMSFVGHEWLEAALKKFVLEYPPQDACLSGYGGKLADFLKGFEPAAAMPYLVDIARLEWAIYDCQNAKEDKVLSAQEWHDIAGTGIQNQSLQFVQAHQFISSDYPLLDLWQAGSGLEVDGEIDLSSGGVRLLVIRPHTEVVLFALKEDEYAFLRSLQKGGSIVAASLAAGWAEESSPLAEAMGRYISDGLFRTGKKGGKE